MMNDIKPSQVVTICSIFGIIFSLLVLSDWLLYTHLYVPAFAYTIKGALMLIHKNIYFIRVIQLLSFSGVAIVVQNFDTNNLKNNVGRTDVIKTEDKNKYLTISLIFSAIYVFGYITRIYDYFYLINLLVAIHYFAKYALCLNLKFNMKEHVDSEVSCLPDNPSLNFEFETDKGLMIIHSPQQGIYIDGGAGAGKSASLIEPIIYQAIMKNFCGLVYDFKGNPPTLGKTAYASILERDKKKMQFPIYEIKDKLDKNGNPLLDKKGNKITEKKIIGYENNVTFASINFSDLRLSNRCNPLAPRYLSNDLYITQAANAVMLSLNKELRKKRGEFFAESGVAIFEGIIKMLHKTKPQYCSLPYVVACALYNGDALLKWLATDEDVYRKVVSVLGALEKGAESQLSGQVSSLQNPIKVLDNPSIFWVLSKDEISLDLNNKKNPVLLSIANDPSLTEALAPGISLIIACCMQQMNQQGKQRSLFCVDELPTIYIDKLDNLPATARSNEVIVCLSVQSYAQLERDYGKDNARVIIGNLGNQFYGMTNEIETAEKIVKLFGEHDRGDTSVTVSGADSGPSKSYSIKREKIFQAKDLMGQKIGHFSGKIAGGDPALFSVQMPYFTIKKQDIPYFAFDNMTGLIDDIVEDTNTLDKLVMDNYKKIHEEVAAFLKPFKPLSEEEKAIADLEKAVNDSLKSKK